MKKNVVIINSGILAIILLVSGCGKKENTEQADAQDTVAVAPAPLSQPLLSHVYTADPSAHVFNGKIYIYPSHDIENDIPFDDLGSHFAMEDYRVLSMNSPGDK